MLRSRRTLAVRAPLFVCLVRAVLSLTVLSELESELTHLRTDRTAELASAERDFAMQVAAHRDQTTAMETQRTQLQQELSAVQQEGEQRVAAVCVCLTVPE